VTIGLHVFGRGRMGSLVSAMAPDAGFVLVGFEAAQVAIEFTVPTAAPGIIRRCLAAGLPVVSGTTGWDAERAAVEAEVRASKGALLWAPNFALGVHLFGQVVEEAARRFLVADAGFDAHLIETHHTKKLDAPSGTAKSLGQRIERAGGRAVPITSVRTGSVPGTHEVVFDAPFEQVRLVHEARDRRVFAAGALTAARWLVGRRGVHTLDDLLGDSAR
jgi:4-hydroxy-tetrahydrodipicolinate reductase